MKIDRKEMNGTSEFIIPGFVGIMIFVIIPLVDVFISSFQKSGTGSFAGLQNYALVMENDAFRLAAGNSIRFELVSVPLLIVISLVVAIEVHGMKSNIMKFAFLIPMAIPSNSLTVVWRILFDDQGVSDEDKPHIFETFYSKRNNHKTHFGLGLSIAKSIADLHSAELTVSDNSPQGSVFSLTWNYSLPPYTGKPPLLP